MATKSKRNNVSSRAHTTIATRPSKTKDALSLLTQRIYNALSPEFSKYEILLETTPKKKIGGYVVSPSFQGNTQLVRQQRIWRLLEKKLKQNELHRIVGILTFTPEERNFILTE